MEKKITWEDYQASHMSAEEYLYRVIDRNVWDWLMQDLQNGLYGKINDKLDKIIANTSLQKVTFHTEKDDFVITTTDPVAVEAVFKYFEGVVPPDKARQLVLNILFEVFKRDNKLGLELCRMYDVKPAELK